MDPIPPMPTKTCVDCGRDTVPYDPKEFTTVVIPPGDLAGLTDMRYCPPCRIVFASARLGPDALVGSMGDSSTN